MLNHEAEMNDVESLKKSVVLDNPENKKEKGCCD